MDAQYRLILRTSGNRSWVARLDWDQDFGCWSREYAVSPRWRDDTDRLQSRVFAAEYVANTPGHVTAEQVA